MTTAVLNTQLRAETPLDESLVEIGAQPGLLGVLARPASNAALRQRIAVVIVVGGPQTRVGSHRQFVLLARALAAAGYPCLRFDYTGMGDSPGPLPNFEAAGGDIRLACDALLDAEPGCRRIALWGLCDGATAALFHAMSDARVSAVIAANPWARSDATRSAALVQTHYRSRLRSAEFWKKLASGRIDVFGAAREAVGHAWRSRARNDAPPPESLPERLAGALTDIDADLRLQLSGNDLTAAEFELAMKAARVFERSPATVLRLDGADHTFSDPAAWSSVIADTLDVLSRTSSRVCET